MSGQKFHRTILVVEVLGNEPFRADLEELSTAVIDGAYSGDILSTSTTEVDRDQVAALLTMQGSDPAFLIGDGD